MKIIAPIPCFNRFPLVELTASRLKRQGVIPILIGHENEIKQIANDLNIEFIQAPNVPLANKWNKGFMACKSYNPDGVMFMGSSDWCSDDYIQSVNENLNDFNLLGMLGCHFVDVAENIRLVHWPGYDQGMRHQEPIGIGRVLRFDFLNEINWKPFDDNLNAGLDWSMWLKVLNTNQKIGIFNQKPEIQLLSISTNKWSNKHKFNDHWNGKLKSTICDIDLLKKEFNEIQLLKQ
jgi:hypothetical protein